MIIQPYRELITRGLQGWWLHGSENGTDASGNARNGTVSGSPSWGDFMNQRAINFDGSDDLVSNCGNTSSFSFLHTTGVFSIAFKANWFADNVRYFFGSTLSGTEKGILVGRESLANYGINVMRITVQGGVGQKYILFGTTNDNVATAGSDDYWCYVGNQPVNTVGQWYKNGVAVTTTSRFSSSDITGTTGLATGDSTRTLRLGAANWTSVLLPVKGYMADIRIYNVALTADEVAAIAAGRG